MRRVREEKSRREKSREEKESEERRCRCAKSRLAKAAGAEPSGQIRDEKLYAVVARRTFPSQNVQNTPGSDHFWKLRCGKSARRCGAKHVSKSKRTKHLRDPQCRSTFGSCDVEKVHAVVARSTFPSRSQKWKRLSGSARSTFGRSDVVLHGRRKGFCTLPEVSKT